METLEKLEMLLRQKEEKENELQVLVQQKQGLQQKKQNLQKQIDALIQPAEIRSDLQQSGAAAAKKRSVFVKLLGCILFAIIVFVLFQTDEPSPYNTIIAAVTGIYAFFFVTLDKWVSCHYPLRKKNIADVTLPKAETYQNDEHYQKLKDVLYETDLKLVQLSQQIEDTKSDINQIQYKIVAIKLANTTKTKKKEPATNRGHYWNCPSCGAKGLDTDVCPYCRTAREKIIYTDSDSRRLYRRWASGA